MSAFNAITYKLGVSTNGSQLPGTDYISAMLFYNSTPPALWPTTGASANVVKCYSVQDAINAGLTGKHEDETKAQGTIAVTANGSIGDIIKIYVQELYGPPVLLCSYTHAAGDTTTTILGASIAAAITANGVNNGGYTATSTTGTITITARPGLGAFLNSGTPITSVVTSGSTYASTITQFSSGAGSKFDIYYYHIQEYFQMNPQGILYVGIYDVPGTYTFSEIQTMQGIATTGNGPQFNQIGVYVDAHAFTAGDITSLETIKAAMGVNHTPVTIFLQGDIQGTADVGSLASLASLAATGVSSICGQDGGAQGNLLFNAYGKSVGNLGAVLGVCSLGSVSSDFAQPIPSNNISQATYGFPVSILGVIGTNTVQENSIPAFANGQLFQPIYSSSGTKLTQLDNYRWIYIGQYPGYVGTFFSENQTCTLQNASIAYVNDDRVTNKIERLLYPAYLPYLKSQITLNSDGTIANTMIPVLQSAGQNALNVMLTNNELSATKVVVNPNQNITSTGKLVVTLYDVETAIARNIEIDINTVSSIPS
ncbi:MAG: hypothetical protein KGI54_17350 [Pseudomonadota bacterium]|nr:hypothetical protein [Pseudomonadota bacterium]